MYAYQQKNMKLVLALLSSAIASGWPCALLVYVPLEQSENLMDAF